MFSHGFVFLWIGYFLIRQTTTKEFKRLRMSGKSAQQVMGIMFLLLGIRRTCLDEGCWSEIMEAVLYYPIFFVMPILILTLAIIGSRAFKRKSNSIKQPIYFFRLITWDIWLITAIGVFLFFYPAILIWL